MKKVPIAPLLLAAAMLLASGGSLDAALVALYRFQDNFTDSSGQGNHGTNNGATFATGQAGYGKAGSFGSGAYVTAADSGSLDITSTLTIAAWVFRTGTSSFDGIVAKGPTTGSTVNYPGNYEFRVDSGATGKASFLAERTDTNQLSSSSGTTNVGSGSWVHLAVTVGSGGAVTHYFNGVVAGTGTLTSWGEANNELLYIGSRKDLFTGFDGLLDDVAIFNEVLTQTQINTVRSGDFTAFGVPEPTAATLLGLAALGVCLIRVRR